MDYLIRLILIWITWCKGNGEEEEKGEDAIPDGIIFSKSRNDGEGEGGLIKMVKMTEETPDKLVIDPNQSDKGGEETGSMTKK